MNCKQLLAIALFSCAALNQSVALQAQRLHPRFEPPPKNPPGHLECQVPAANAQNAPPAFSTNFYYGIDTAGNVTDKHADGYYQISDGIEDLKGWLAATAPTRRILLPFTDKTVVLGTGWMYNGEARHNAIDYWTNNNTYTVRAVADGKVIWVGYHPSPGNIVIIQHSLPVNRGVQHFRTIYHHLRNGRDNDLALARATMMHSVLSNLKWEDASNPDTAYIRKYQDDATAAVMQLNNPIVVSEYKPGIEARWGTNEQKLMVKVGDTLKAGQQIGWAGTTGFDTGGIHLHIMFARQATHNNNGTKQNLWTFFDPYGLYTLRLMCYQPPYGSGTGPKQHQSYFGQQP